MTPLENARELQDVQIMAEKTDSVLLAVSEAVCAGTYALDNYRWSFTVLQEMSGELRDKLMEMTERAMEEIRKEKEQEEM